MQQIQSLLAYSKYFEAESSQLAYWCKMLHEIKMQITFLTEIYQKKTKCLTSLRESFSKSKESFVENIEEFKNEPSNIYTIFSTVLKNFNDISDIAADTSKSTCSCIVPNSVDLISNISGLLDNIISTSQKIMNDAIKLKNKNAEQDQAYKKAKNDLEDLKVMKKKIENDPLTAYDDIEKSKAESKVNEQIMKMEQIMLSINQTSEEINKNKDVFNKYMNDTFELVLINVFKGLAFIHQIFIVIDKGKYEAYQKVGQMLKTNFYTFSFNDYSERKFAKENGRNFSPLFFDDEDIYNDDDPVALCDNIVAYTETFVKCMKIRKKILSFFGLFLKDVSKSTEATEKFKESVKSLNSIIQKFETLSTGNKKTWTEYQTYYNSNLITFISIQHSFPASAINSISLAAKEMKDDYTEFEKKIAKIMRKSIKYREEYDKSNDEKKRKEKKEKIRKKLNENKCLEEIQKEVKGIREKDTKRVKNIMLLIENLMNQITRNIKENLFQSKQQIESVATMDIYQETNEMFRVFFTKFGIENYEDLMESMRVKLLTKVDFTGSLSQKAYDSITSYFSETGQLPMGGNNVSGSYCCFDLESVESIGSNRGETDNVDNEELNFVSDKNFKMTQNFKQNDIDKLKVSTKVSTKNINRTKTLGNDNVELEEGESLIEKYKCEFKKQKGYIYLTNERVIFQNKNKKFSFPIKDIESVEKKEKFIVDIKTNKTVVSFKHFFENDTFCSKFKELQKPENENKKDKEEGGEPNSTSNKFDRQVLGRNTEVKKMLTKIEFFQKLQSLTEQRKAAITSACTEQFQFMDEKDFEKTFVDEEIGINAPLSLIFNLIFNPQTGLSQFDHGKSFFENVYTERGDLNLTLTYDESQNEKIPKFFSEIEYGMDLFTNMCEEDLVSFLEEVPQWNNSIQFEIKFVHPIKKMFIGPDRVTMRDVVNVYFVSPTDLIVDYHSYGSDFPFMDTFVSCLQYRFHSDIGFNMKNGMIQFKTKCKIYYVIKMVKSCMFESKLKEEGYATNEEEIKFKIFENIMMVLKDEASQFEDIYKKLNDENLRKSLYKYEIAAEGDTPESEEEKEKEKEEEKKESEEAEKKGESPESTGKKGLTKKTQLLIFIGFLFLSIVVKMILNLKDNPSKFFSFDTVSNIGILGLIIYLVIQIKQNK